MKKTFLLTSLLASTLVLSAVTFAGSHIVQQTNASEELSLNSDTDAFVLLDKSFAEDESFVYTADLHFRSGQAGALAFGAEENDHYFVINMDRFENHVKLLYFQRGEGGFVDELYSDDFLGNGTLLQQEWEMINPWVREIENVNIKVVLTREDEHAYVEFFVEGIKRFGVDTTIDLNNLAGKSYKYLGGHIGMNVFNADAYLTNIEYGHSDYSYFSEPYRNQFHLQPFAKWTNDPNALCYFNGWYHVFYQTNPFGLYWGAMFWGHARSRDLIHWEFLPVCLFPERAGRPGFEGDAYMWSGCAITYYQGMSEEIDAKNWFVNGNGDGLIAIYTRDGAYQDQEIIYSDNEGLTWVKTGIGIHQTMVNPYKQDWRDPKVFPLTRDGETGKVTTWGMTLSGYVATRKGYFLKSNNLLDWSLAGSFNFPNPECIGVGFLTDYDDNVHAYLTNKSRTYILGTMEYNGGDIIFKDESGTDISTYSLEEIEARMKPLDFGPDTYASQSFYIDDDTSEYCFKDIVLNWFSGDLNAPFCTGPGEYANLRGRWNGGFTIPVEYGVYEDNNGEFRISQKPITVKNNHLEKTQIVNLSDISLTSESEDPLGDVHTHVFELIASIDVNDDSPITFKVDIGDNEYMEFGWNKVDGYYVDRTNLDDKGINTNVDWHVKYASHILGDSNNKTFYVLSDNGGLEVFCENFSIPFYFVTTASMYSTGASLKADNATINSLRLSEIKSVYRGEIAEGEGKLYVSNNEVDLDETLATSKFVTCYFSGNDDLSWEVVDNDDVVSFISSNKGIQLDALKPGTAEFKVSAGEQSENIVVRVHESSFKSDLTFNKNGIVSGNWLAIGDGIVGEKDSGNGFILAEEEASDFVLAGQFDILSGTAGALVFRASKDMSSYLVANYDANEHVIKLWSTHGELARSEYLDLGLENITLTIKASGKDILISANGVDALHYTLADNEPLSGHFGLNVFSGKAKFKTLSLLKENYEYESGDLAVKLSVNDFVTGVYNLTLNNVRLEPGYYYQEDSTLYIRESYFKLLPASGVYEFKIVGASLSFVIKVNVNLEESTLVINDLTVDLGTNVVVYVGKTPINSVMVNNVTLNNEQYSVNNYTLSISHEVFKEGENQVVINGDVSFKVIVVNHEEEVEIEEETTPKKKSGFAAWLEKLVQKIKEFFRKLFGGNKK